MGAPALIPSRRARRGKRQSRVVGSQAKPERVQRAQQVGFEPIKISVAQFRDGPPPDLGEFALVRMHGLSSASCEGEPEADVHVPHRGRTHSLGHREEERPFGEHRVELGADAEFLDGLAAPSVSSSRRITASAALVPR
jgi:hypothetical protein